MLGAFLSKFLRFLRGSSDSGQKSPTSATPSNTSSPSESPSPMSTSKSQKSPESKIFSKVAELKREDYELAASVLGVDVSVVLALAEVESGPYGAFLADGRPVILFERAKFTEFTGGRYVATHPDLNAIRWNEKPYGKLNEQWDRYLVAKSLDAEAAAKSCSWGLFQIMGFNYKAAGFKDLGSFVKAMSTSAREHLFAFVAFIDSKPQLKEAVQRKDWETIAKLYNGTGQVPYYSSRLKQAHARIAEDLANGD